MKIEEKINKRFLDLIDTGNNIKATRRSHRGTSIVDLSYDYVDEESAHQWGSNCLHLLRKVFGADSNHYKKFDELYSKFSNSRYNSSEVNNAVGILKQLKMIMKMVIFSILAL